MKYISIIILVLAGFLFSCEDHEVGFLNTEYAKYKPDSLYISQEVDDKREQFKIPWVSTSIQGVQGTYPLTMSVSEVKSETSIALDQFLQNVSVRGNGIIEVKYDHSIPSGRYLISLEVKNEGHTKQIPDVFTIIVE